MKWTVATMTASSSRSDDHHVIVAKRRQRPSRCREAAIAMTSSPRRLCCRREATNATVSSPRSGDRHHHDRLVVAKRRPSCCRREATTATVASPCGNWSTFPECFWALSSGRTTARAATKVHDKDLSHTKLRVSARRTPLCDLRSPALLCAVCLFRSSLLSLCWRCFCRWFCCVLYSSRVLLCPPPLASASALVFSSARSLVAVVCGSGGGVAVGAWSRLWDRRRRPVVAAVGRRRFALLIFLVN